jgi:endogenous inhibitor of DNA gyrase (YacG/DUF329 family)
MGYEIDFDDRLSDTVYGSPCPECGSDDTTLMSTTRNGFCRMSCNDCDHDWIED